MKHFSKTCDVARCGILTAVILCSSSAVHAQQESKQQDTPATASGATPSAAEVATEKAFREGNEWMEKREYEQALTAYKRGLATAPNDSSLLWNGGMAGYLSSDYASALALWQRLKKKEPRDGNVRAKLIQTHQAMKKRGERDTERAQLFALRAEVKKENPEAEALKQKQYCRDQFTAAGRRVFAYEFFELEGPMARRYKFTILQKGADTEDFNISLGSYETTNAFMRERGDLKPGQRVFHLDGYYPRGIHKTFGFFVTEPSYDQTREMIEKILAGKQQPISSSAPGKR